MNGKHCVLDETKLCDECGQCRVCDLDPGKLCDNCMKCLNLSGAEYRGIEIERIELPGKQNTPGELLFGDEDAVDLSDLDDDPKKA